MKRYGIALDLLLQTPMHITAIEPGRYNPANGRVRRNTEDQIFGLPCSLTRMMEVALASPRMASREGAEDKPYYKVLVPTIPANTIAGRLRRKAAALIVESLVARSQTITAKAFNTLSAGTADASLNRAQSTVAMLVAAREDAYLSVFGGTSFALTRNLKVSEGYPVTPDTLQLLSIPPQTATVYGDEKLTGVIHFTRKDDIYDLRDPRKLEQAIGLEPVSEYLEGIVAGRAGKKARQEEEKKNKQTKSTEVFKKTELAANACLEVVRPGLNYALRLDLTAYDDSQLGFALLCLQRFANEAQIGGKAAGGFGRFNVTSARIFGYEGFERSESGIEIWARGPGDNYLFADEPFIQRAVQAGQDYVDMIDAATIEAFVSGEISIFKKKAA